MPDGGLLNFSVRDVVDGREVGPGFLPFALLQAFADEVGRFLRGGTRLVDLAVVPLAVEGAATVGFQLAATLDADTHATLARECAALAAGPGGLVEVDPRRAEIVLAWQEAARKCPRRVYRVYDPAGERGEGLRIDARTLFLPPEEDVWVEVEKYLFGRVVEAGGKTNTNLHLVLDNATRETIIVTATEQQLQQDDHNRLFHEVLLHVSARQNLRTGLLRDVTLLDFSDQTDAIDEALLERMVERGTLAWTSA